MSHVSPIVRLERLIMLYCTPLSLGPSGSPHQPEHPHSWLCSILPFCTQPHLKPNHEPHPTIVFRVQVQPACWTCRSPACWTCRSQLFAAVASLTRHFH